MTEKNKTSATYSSLKGFHRAVPIIMYAVAAFTLFSFILDMGLVGNAISGLFLGLFSYGAYALPLLICLHAVFYPSDLAEKRIVSRVIFSLVTIIAISSLAYAITYWNADFVFHGKQFFNDGKNSIGGGFIGSLVGFCLVTAFSKFGLVIITVATFAIYISYFFAKGQKSISAAVIILLRVIVVLCEMFCEFIKSIFGKIKNAKNEKKKRVAEQKSIELTEDEFFGVDNGMQKLNIPELGIRETKTKESLEASPTLQDKVFHKSIVSPEEAEEMEEMEMRERAAELFAKEQAERAAAERESTAPKRRIVNVNYGDLNNSAETSEEKPDIVIEEPEEEITEVKPAPASIITDESADSIFTRDFDPFSMVMSEELASKPSSRSLLDEKPTPKIASVKEDISEMTEEDVERIKQREEFERRKASIIGARKAIPVDNDGEFTGTRKNVEFRESVTERIEEITEEDHSMEVKIEKSHELPKAEPARYTPIGYGDSLPPFAEGENSNEFKAPETIYSHEEPAEIIYKDSITGTVVYDVSANTDIPESPVIAYKEEPAIPLYKQPEPAPQTEEATPDTEEVKTADIPEEPPVPLYERPAPTPVYEEPKAPVYEAPAPTYREEPAAPIYERPAPTPVYEEPKAPVYEAPAPTYREEPATPIYERPAPAPVYEEPKAPVYEAPAPTYREEPAAPIYERPAPTPVYEDPKAPVYEAPAPTYREEPTTPIYERPAPAPVYEEPKAPVYEAPAPAEDKEINAIVGNGYISTENTQIGNNGADYVPEFKPYEPTASIEAESNDATEKTEPEAVNVLKIERTLISDDNDTVTVAPDTAEAPVEEAVTETPDVTESEDEDDDTVQEFDDKAMANEDGEFNTTEIPPEERNPVVQGYKDMFPALRDEEPEVKEDNTNDYQLVSPDEVDDTYDYDEPDPDPDDYDDPPFDGATVPVRDKASDKAKQEPKKEEKKKPDYSKYQLPSIDLLGLDPIVDDDNSEITENTNILIDTLASFHVTASIKGVDRGPRITRYEVVPARGVKVQSITSLFNDITLNLAKEGVRMEAPIPGKSAVGFEIPNKSPKNVRLRELLECEEFAHAKSKTFVSIGKDVAGNPVFGDISKYPHALICGATGMGKSVCINSILVSMLYKARPDEVKFIMIDPKKVEFKIYSGIPHLLIPVITESKQAAGALMWAVEEMERRYEIIEKNFVRNIEAYNEKVAFDPSLGEPLPKIVIVIDELADLMMQVRDPVEDLIMRIAQKARAAGIHLIIGTQRPSVQVITGAIKANIPSRISCKVTSQVDSRTIFDVGGAEKLLNRGDMLYWPVDRTAPLRVQGAFVSDGEVEAIMNFLKENADGNQYDDEVMAEINKAAQKCGNNKKGGGVSADDIVDDDQECGYYSDQQFLDAVDLAIRSKKISTSLLQRKLSIGYGKAAKYIDAMEEIGVVSEPKGQKPRDVLITMDEWHEKLARVDLD